MIREQSIKEIEDINKQFNPILNDMRSKMAMLAEKYEVNVSLQFDAITQLEVEQNHKF